MERVSVDGVEPEGVDGGAARRGLTEALGATDVAINHYRLDAGERSAGLHAHADQEEVFLVVEGEAAFETMDGEVVAGAGEVIRFAPGEFHSGVTARDGAVAALALGAPRDTEDVRIPLTCPRCGHDERRPGLPVDGASPVLVCPDCGGKTAATCPECGSDAMRAELADGGETPVGVCGDCGSKVDG